MDIVEALQAEGLPLTLKTFQAYLYRQRRRQPVAVEQTAPLALLSCHREPAAQRQTVCRPGVVQSLISSSRGEQIMIVAVINFSGNVGKTTVTQYLLSSRMNHAKVIPIKSINADEVESKKICDKQYGDLQQCLATVDDAVVDVGVSNVEDFMALMQQYHGSHAEFDYFVVPTVSALKQ